MRPTPSTVMFRKLTAGACLLAAGLFAGCSSDDPEVAEGAASVTQTCKSTTDESAVFVATYVDFGEEPAEGVVRGLNLDDKVSDSDDLSSCQIRDFTDPGGTAGIDNQFAGIWKVVENVVGNTVEGLLQSSINDGSLLLMFEIEGLDDYKNDPCVTLNVFNGIGQPALGTNNRLAPHQTFDLKPKTPFARALNGKVENGVLTAGPFEAVIPVQVFQLFFDLRVHNAYFRANLSEDFTIDGVLAGGIEVEQILAIGEDAASRDASAAVINGALPAVVGPRADMAYDPNDDTCHQLSAGLHFQASPAFVFESTDPLKAKATPEKAYTGDSQ